MDMNNEAPVEEIEQVGQAQQSAQYMLTRKTPSTAPRLYLSDMVESIKNKKFSFDHTQELRLKEIEADFESNGEPGHGLLVTIRGDRLPAQFYIPEEQQVEFILGKGTGGSQISFKVHFGF